MIIWLALVLPIPAVAVLYWKFHHRIVLWEVLIMFATPVVCVSVGKLLVDAVQSRDKEYWGGWVTQAEYYEDWNERVNCRHPISCTHPEYSTDSKGKRYQSGYKHLNDGHYHSYDVDDHDPYWEVATSNGHSMKVSQQKFEALATRFGNRAFVELNRSFHTDDGDKYVALWKGERERLEPATTEHSYENRVQASTSIFNFPEIDPRENDLYEYPPITEQYYQRCVLGDAGPTTVDGEKRFQELNALLGREKELRLYVLVFRDRGMQAATDQMTYWKGGNKNELVSCVGVDANSVVQWAYVFSWTEVESIKVEARDFLAGQKALDLTAYAAWLEPVLRERWIRKRFEDFAYLTVEPPGWVIMTTFIVTFLATGAVCVFAIINDENPGDRNTYRPWELGRRIGS